ncbi:MAG TPA: tripartite tricarboxylate transporter substrate binding protein [Xanthobacteraceae bacterium]
MKLQRRRFLHLAAGAGALSAVSRIARAQAYPSRPVRLIVGFAAGGAPDIVARLLGQWLSARLGAPFIIENRSGAGGSVATEAVAHAPPDGHALLFVTSANTINMTLDGSLNFIRDIVPVASISREPIVMAVNPSFPATTVPEFISHAKSNPGRLSMGSPGTGTSPHMAGELFKFMTGIDLVHVPYRGSPPALIDLIGGRLQVMFSPLPPSIEYIRTGKLRALAVTTAARSGALPDIPTVGDFVPGYEASAFYGIGAPAGTSADIIDRLNQEINAALADRELRAQLVDLGSAVLVGSPADFSKLVVEETEKWAKVVKLSGAKPD